MPSTNFSSLKALIFDFDGLMVDTETAIYQAWQEIYESHGHNLPLATYVQCVGSHANDYDPARELNALVGRELDWTSLMQQQSDRIHELHAGLGPFPGVRELLEEANSVGVACAVASSSSSNWVRGWLDKLDLTGLFHQVITRDLVKRAKPAPDLFLLAMERLAVNGSSAVVLEDSANGLKAAVAAEVPCIIVPNIVTAGLDFSQAHAVLPTLHGVGVDHLETILSPR